MVCALIGVVPGTCHPWSEDSPREGLYVPGEMRAWWSILDKLRRDGRDGRYSACARLLVGKMNIQILNVRYRHCDVVEETAYQQHPHTPQRFEGTDAEINKGSSLPTSQRSDSDKGFNCSV